MSCLGRQTCTFQQVTGLLVFYFFMGEVITDMGTDVLKSSVESLDFVLFLMSPMIPIQIDLEPGIGDRNIEPLGSPLIYLGPRVACGLS